MGKTTFAVTASGIQIKNYLKSSQLTKFLSRYADVDVEDGKEVTVSVGTAVMIMGKLREVTSKLASPLNVAIKEFNIAEEERIRARPIVSYPMDKNGQYLRRGCIVRYRYPEQACLEDDIFWSTFIGIREDGLALIKNDLFYAYLCSDGVYRLRTDSDSTKYPIDLARLTLETRTASEIRAHYITHEEDTLHPVIPPDLDTSGMCRKKKKRKRTTVAVGLTGVDTKE